MGFSIPRYFKKYIALNDYGPAHQIKIGVQFLILSLLILFFYKWLLNLIKLYFPVLHFNNVINVSLSLSHNRSISCWLDGVVIGCHGTRKAENFINIYYLITLINEEED